MKPVTEQMHDLAVYQVDRLISLAEDAKENVMHHRYEDAMCNLDEIIHVRKKAESTIGELYD